MFVRQLFDCLTAFQLIKRKPTVSFPRKWITSAQIGQAQNILKGFSPKMKSGSHICISNVLCVSSLELFGKGK